MGARGKGLGIIVAVLGLIIGVSFGSVSAGEQGMQTSFDVAVGVSYLSGNTQYQIGGKVVPDNFPLEVIQFPISELDWPLDTVWATLQGDVSFHRWRLGAKVQKNLTDDPGNMVDRDWGIYGYPFDWRDTLEIYSETDTDLDGWIWDVNADFTFYRVPQWSFFAGIGYTYQNFDFEGSNTKQWQRNPFTSDRIYTNVAGNTIDYEVTYKIPYMRLGTIFTYKDKMGTDRFTMEGSFAYSPIVDAEDEDNHLVRNPPFTARSDTDGDAFIWAFKSRYNFRPQWFLGLNFDYTKINTDGSTRVVFPGPDAVNNYRIGIELESSQTQATFEVGYEF